MADNPESTIEEKIRQATQALREGKCLDGSPLDFAAIASRNFQSGCRYSREIRRGEEAARAKLLASGKKFIG